MLAYQRLDQGQAKAGAFARHMRIVGGLLEGELDGQAEGVGVLSAAIARLHDAWAGASDHHPSFVSDLTREIHRMLIFLLLRIVLP